LCYANDKLSPLQFLLATFRIFDRQLSGEEQTVREGKGAIISELQERGDCRLHLRAEIETLPA